MKKLLRKISGLFMVGLMSFSALSPVIVAAAEAGKVEINKTAQKIGDEKTSRKAEVTLSVNGNSFTSVDKTDIVLVLDRSGSMDDKLDGTEKRISAKNAANDLVDTLITSSTGDGVKIAVVPFGTKVNDSLVTGLTANKNIIKNAINQTYNSPIGNQATNVQEGLKKASDLLSSSTNNKIVILLSDGGPTKYTDPTYGVVGDGADDSTACLEYGFMGFSCKKYGVKPSEAANQVATNLKNNNTTIYTVGFGNGIDGVATSFLTNVASSGKYYSASNQEALKEAFKNIATDINVIATDVLVSDVVPEGFVVDEEALKRNYGDSVTITHNGQETILTWNLGNLNANNANELKYVVTAKEGYYGSMYTNKEATITGTPTDGNPYYDGKFNHTFPKPSVVVPGITTDDNYALNSEYDVTVGKRLNISAEKGLLSNDKLSVEMMENADSVANRIVVDASSLCGALNVNEETGEFTYIADKSCVSDLGANTVTFDYYVETSVIKDGKETVVKSNSSTVTLRVVKQATTYQVRYLEEGTDTPLAPTKSENGYVGDLVSENAIDIKGYERVSVPTKELVLEEQGNVIDFFYKRKTAQVSQHSISKTGTISISKRDVNVDYQIVYSANVDEYMGNATVTIVDTLPYMIDVSKSDLAGGVYDGSNNTITWEVNVNDIDTYENGIKNVSVTKNISVSYLGIDITADTLENFVTGDIELETTKVDKVSDSASTEINIKGTLKVHYVDKNGNNLLDVEASTKKAGTNYETSAKQINGYEVIKVEGQTSGKYSDSLIEVIYTYDRVKADVSEENTNILKTGTTDITSKDDKVDYKINYQTEVNNYIGNGTITIIDTLPYEIDTNRKYDLDGGVYDAQNKTITWVENISDVNTYVDGVKNIAIEKQISFYYKDLNIEEEKVTNTAKGVLSLETVSDVERQTTFDTSVNINGKLVVKHVDINGNELLPTQETVKKAGTPYQTTKKEIKDYDFVRVEGSESGKYTDETIQVKYVYQRKVAKVTEDKVVKTGTIAINSSDVSVAYEINYSANITDYLGDATVTIVDTLPYMIDVSKSNLDGGVYDVSKNTITWVQKFNDVDTYVNGTKNVNITKNIELFYLGIDVTSASFINKVKANVELETAKVTPKEDEFETEVNVNGNLVTKYVDEDGNELLPMVRSEAKAGTKYQTEAKKISGYTLKEVIGNESGTYLEGTVIVTYVYERTLTNYVVKYLENGTNKKLASQKRGVGYVGETISENALKLDGYTLTSENTISIVLDEEENEITFYYDKVMQVVSTGINDVNNPYGLLLLVFTSILGGLVYLRKKTS